MASTAPKADEPSLPPKLVDEARRLSVAVEGRTEEQVRKEVQEAWIAENREAIEASNAWVEKHGLPLARYRQF